MINKFEDNYFFLSNYYPHTLVIDGITYPTLEHYFQACKTLDKTEKRGIAAATSPGEAKYLGRRVALRADWEEVKEAYMLQGLSMKFSDPDLRAKLIATGDEHLEEGNWWRDMYWGTYRGKGQNRLGHLLMQLRTNLKEEEL